MATQTYTPLATGATPALGTSGSAVAALQTQLNTTNAGKAGYVPLVVDGKYGALTQAASTFTPAGTTTTNGATGAVNPVDAHAIINGGQENDFNTVTSTDGTTPPVKGAGTAPDSGTATSTGDPETDAMNALKAEIAPAGGAPAVPNLTNTYTGLLQTSGINDLETQLSTLKANAQSIKDAYTATQTGEEGKPVAMNVITGRQSQEDQEMNEKLAPITDQINSISDQLTQKYNVVNSLMTYGEKDYDNAVADYDKQYANNISLMNAVKTQSATDNTATDNARANLQIIYNNLSSGTTDLSSISPDEKATITKLETQAGLPVGFYASITSKNPNGTILSTTTRDDGGTKYADVITKDQTGKVSVQSIPIGTSTSATGNSASQKNDIASAIIDFQNQMKDKGWAGANPDAYQSYKTQLMNTYGAAAGLALDAAMSTAGITVDTTNK